MTWVYLGVSVFAFGFIAVCVWWLVNLGKQIARGEEDKRHNIELKKQGKEKNIYAKDIDNISKREDALKKTARDAFRRGDLGGVVRSLDAARKGSKADKK